MDISSLKYFVRHKQSTIDNIALYLSLLCSMVTLVHLGFSPKPLLESIFRSSILIAFYTLFIANFIRTLLSIWAEHQFQPKHYAGLFIFAVFLIIAFTRILDPKETYFFAQDEWIYLGIFSITLAEISRSSLFLDKLYFNPTLLFVTSFIGLILLGSFLLMLPNSVKNGETLSFVDALFMATSAVCITGLTVVDVGHTFSFLGQSIILVLIQLGGLGIMTFTGFFGYFFSGGFSFKNQLMYGEILGQNKVGAVINTLLKIITVTLLIEFLGAVFIFFSVPKSQFANFSQHVFFSIFHAISAFCNAGFTIVENGFSGTAYKFNYHFQLILVSLFILGGLGFIIVFNGFTYFKRLANNLYHVIRTGRPFVHKAWVITFNARLMAWTSLALIILSTLTFLIVEYHHSLQEHQGFFQKLTAAFFMGNSSRTSGFSLTEINQISLPMLMSIMVFMWIGASPGSTGGGIKNTTFAIALLNILSLSRGKDKLEIFHRRISQDSINKAFAIIMLSFVAMGLALSGLSITDGDKSFKSLVFETISAYATCGLSLGITPELSDGGKMIITATMFAGRLGFLTLLVAVIKNYRNKSYTFPEEKVLF